LGGTTPAHPPPRRPAAPQEEGNELLQRVKAHLEGHPDMEEPLPMFTSCCPGWVGESPAAAVAAALP
jgi:hypothetical protein